jgi:glycosyltransferase involved in cell wall biosynthesis
MRIAVVKHIDSGDYAEYLSLLINEAARQNDYQIKTWSSSVPASQQFIAENAVVYILIESRAQLALKWWYAKKLTSVLKKINAKVVFELNGIASNRIKASQVIALGQETINGSSKTVKAINRFAFKFIGRSISNAKNIFIYSQQKITGIKEMAGMEEKIQVLPFTAPLAFKTFEWHEKIMIKAQQADNKEYFIAALQDDGEEDFVLLMRAFSKFKKWQQSSMQLLLLPKYESFAENIQQKHATYKYRDDVRLIEELEETQIASIIASAYALLHVSSAIPDLMMIAIALQCSLPIIAFKDDDVEEYAGEAALYPDEKNFEALGEALMQLYKDENLHTQLKETAKEKASALNRKETEMRLWQTLETAARS